MMTFIDYSVRLYHPQETRNLYVNKSGRQAFSSHCV